MAESPQRSPGQPERAPRDRYAEVGQAGRSSIARHLETESRLSPTTRVHYAVLHLTAMYSRLTARVYVDQVGRVARIPGDKAPTWNRTREALKELARRRTIFWGPAQGRSIQSWVSLVDPAERQPPLAAVVHENPRTLGQKTPALQDGKPPHSGGAPMYEVREEVREGVREGAHDPDASELDAELAALDELLAPLGPEWQPWAAQRPRWAEAHAEDPRAFRGAIAEIRGDRSITRPAAMLDTMILDGSWRTKTHGPWALQACWLDDELGMRRELVAGAVFQTKEEAQAEAERLKEARPELEQITVREWKRAAAAGSRTCELCDGDGCHRCEHTGRLIGCAVCDGNGFTEAGLCEACDAKGRRARHLRAAPDEAAGA
jgi:hypothetical protein